MKYVITEYGTRQQTIHRTMAVDLPEELADDLGAGHELDTTLSHLADEAGVPWEEDEDDIWEESGNLEVDCEDVGDQFDGRLPVLVVPSREEEAT